MRIDVRHNFGAVNSALLERSKQYRFAVAVALTRTAYDGRDETVKHMSQVLHQPTRYTQRSLLVKQARRNDLTAFIEVRGIEDKNSRNAHYKIGHLWTGGNRNHKRFEEALIRIGAMRNTEYAIPTSFAPKNAYGNVPVSFVREIMSALALFQESGFQANATRNSRATKRREKQGVRYFISRGVGSSITFRNRKGGIDSRRQHLIAGIWMARRFAVGEAIKPMYVFVPKATYKRFIKMDEVVNRIVPIVFPKHLAAAINLANATAR